MARKGLAASWELPVGLLIPCQSAPMLNSFLPGSLWCEMPVARVKKHLFCILNFMAPKIARKKMPDSSKSIHLEWKSIFFGCCFRIDKSLLSSQGIDCFWTPPSKSAENDNFEMNSPVEGKLSSTFTPGWDVRAISPEQACKFSGWSAQWLVLVGYTVVGTSH